MYQEFLKIDLDATVDLFRSNTIQMIAMAKFSLPHISRGDSYVSGHLQSPTCRLLKHNPQHR